MATIITSECINCGACESECPNTAIYQGAAEWELNGVTHPAMATETFYIVPDKCTECVGFFDHEACAAVCPVDCCIPDPNRPESETVLVERARQLHADKTFGNDVPSRFRKEGTAAPAVTTVSKPAAAATPAPAPPPVAAAKPAADSKPIAVVAPASTPKPAAAAQPPATAAPALSPAAPGKPAAAVTLAPAPPPTAAAKTEVAQVSSAIPDIKEWEVPIECFRCYGTYAVAFKHLRSGMVLRCPSCGGSYVVTTELHNHLHRQLDEFRDGWRHELEAVQAKRQRELGQYCASLKGLSVEIKPPGAPRKRAGAFG